ncbi:hypothetical protein NGM10_03295 [Halorussus salilacus]|uniref:hypothetical protein n=1 Tax=Halorussus salilacus TaxID=2953750 RepID=UPI0020A0F292|nr:hypothetical protein [Halorussus salilacus]USZ68770.1 hypothetical protein NGM10_03295 [Halorussus salilacus]
MTVRSRLGVLQLPIAGLGVLVVAWTAYQFATIPPSPPESDGFVEGLVGFFLGVSAWSGFLLAALGFAIPPGDAPGIRFNRWQRRLFVGAAAAAVLSLAAPLVALLLPSVGVGMGVAVRTWLVLWPAAVLALVGGLGWRAAEAVAVRVRA